MNVSELQREPILLEARVHSLEDLSHALADEASAVLGYTTTLTRARRRAALQQTLEELDVRPFTHESVQRYKEAGVRQPHWLLSALLNGVAAIGAIAAVAGIPMLIVAALTMNASLAFAVALAIVFGGIALFVFSILGESLLTQRIWLTYDLAYYTKPVPEFALQTAIDIKKKHPEVEFFVCSLEESQVVLDPFLVMRIPGDPTLREYYLEVWNEPEFQGKREA